MEIEQLAEQMVYDSFKFIIPDGTENLSADAKQLVEAFHHVFNSAKENPEGEAKKAMRVLGEMRNVSPDPGGYLTGFMAGLVVGHFVLREPSRAQELLRLFAERIGNLAMVKKYAEALEAKPKAEKKTMAVMMPGDGQLH
jgi:hypothetical protein